MTMEPATVFVLSENAAERVRLSGILLGAGWRVESYASARAFQARCGEGISGSLLIDARLPGALGLLASLRRTAAGLPVLMMTRRISIAVAAMRAGAADVIEKPVKEAQLLDALRRASVKTERPPRAKRKQDGVGNPFADLTPRQLQVLQKVLAGQPSKNIAADLGISRRTVESHRAVIMQRTGSHSLPALARLAVMANWYGDFP